MKTLTNRLSGLVLIGAIMVALFGFKPAFAQYNVDLGSGTLTMSTSTTENPVTSYWRSTRVQFYYTAAEIAAAGGSTSDIDALGLYVTSAGGYTVGGLTIKMKNTPLAAGNGTWHSGTTTVKNAFNYTATAGGYDMITFDNNFNWDGSSNLLVEFCHFSSSCCSFSGATVRRYTAPHRAGETRYTTSAINYCSTTLGGFDRHVKAQVRLHFTGTFVPPPAPVADVIDGPAVGISMEAHEWSTTTAGSGSNQHWEYNFNGGTWLNLGFGQGDPTPAIILNVPVTDATFNIRSHRTAAGHPDAISNVVSTAVECAYLNAGSTTTFYGIRRFRVNGPPPVPGIPLPNVTLLDNSSTRHSLGGQTQDWKASTASSHPATAVVAAFPGRRGATYQFGIGTENATWTHGRVAWIDYNADGDFSDAGELILPPTAQLGGLVDHPVQLSCTAAPGTKSVRVRVDRGSTPFAAPCLASTTLFGELEEYEVVVLPPPFDVPPTPASVGSITMNGDAGATEWWNTEAASFDVTSYVGNIEMQASINGGTFAFVSSCVNVNLRPNNFVNGGTIDIRAIVSPLGCDPSLLPVTATMALDVLCLNNFTSGTPCASGDWISRVKLANVDNNTACGSGPISCLGAPPAFWGGTTWGNVEDFYDDAALEIEICANARYVMKVQTGSTVFNQGISAWMDYNGDGSFNNTNENIFALPATTSDPNQVRNVLLNIPSGGIGNSFRMLVTNTFAGPVGVSACGGFNTFGSHEIYKVTVIDEAPAVSITSNDDDNVICEGESITFSADGGANVSGVQWYFDDGTGLQPIAGATGNTHTINPAELDHAGQYLAEFSFTTGCANTTVETFLTVNPVPVITKMEANPPEACCGGDLTLSVKANAGGSGGAVVIGAGNSSNGYYPYAPFQSFRAQNIYTAGQLAGAGLSAGAVDFLQYEVANPGTGPAIGAFEISMGHTALPSLPGSYTGGLTTVWGPQTYTPTFGTNKHNLSSPFVWNGTDNLIVEVCGNRGVFFASADLCVYDLTGDMTFLGFFNNLGCANASGPAQAAYTPQTGFGRNQSLIYEWNSGDIGQDVNVDADCGASTQTNSYVVTITNSATGCFTISDPIDVVIQPSYGVLATTGDAYIGPNASVVDGSIGSAASDQKTRVKSGVRIANGFAAGDSVAAAPGSLLDEIIYGSGYRGTAGAINTDVWPLSINLPTMPAIPGGANLTYPNYKTTTLTPGDYGRLKGGSYNRIELDPGVYTFTSIYLNSHSQFVSSTGNADEVEVYVAGDVRFKNKNNDVAVRMMADGEIELGPHNVAAGKYIGGSIVVQNEAVINNDGSCWPEIILPDPEPVYNVDYCDSAQLMLCGDVYTGSTSGAINDGAGLPSCGSAFNPGADNWYFVEGTGQTMTVTTCHPTFGFDTNIQVWRDTGGGQGNGCQLACVGGNDDMGFLACQIGPPVQSFRSRVIWNSTSGDVYKIRVSGFGGVTGNYGLTLTCTPKDDAAEELTLLSDASTGVNVFPNPLSTSTTFSFDVAEAGNATLEVFSIAGVKVATLFNGNVEAGSHHTVDMDASELAPGVYFYNLTAGSETVHGKITVAK